jgi:hypothetical protein
VERYDALLVVLFLWQVGFATQLRFLGFPCSKCRLCLANVFQCNLQRRNRLQTSITHRPWGGVTDLHRNLHRKYVAKPWQLPHSVAIAWIYGLDYGRAGLCMLPSADREGRMIGRRH